MLRTLALILILPGALLLFILALQPQDPRADFVIAAEEPRSLDPQQVSWASEIQLANLMFEGLTRLDPQTLRPEPAVAESWEIDPTRTEYTFHLRRDAEWSNGDVVTAGDFRSAWLRALNQKAGIQYASLLFLIAGGETYYTNSGSQPPSAADTSAVGIEVIDPLTLRVRLVAPCPYFLELLAFPTFFPLHDSALVDRAPANTAAGGPQRTPWTRPGRLIGNGPFVLTAWEFKHRLRFQRSAHYWDCANIALNRIDVVTIADPNVQLVAYETGAVDLMRGVPTAAARALKAAQDAGQRRDFHSGPRFATFFFRVNCRRPPLDDARFRQALALTVDRAALVQQVLGLGEEPAATFVPRSAIPLMPRIDRGGKTIWYDPPRDLDADRPRAERIAAARELLRQTAYDGRPIEIAYASDNRDYQRIAEAVQQMWIDSLGIRVVLRAQESKVLSQRIRNLDYDLARSDWFGDFLDPSTFLQMFVTASNQNRTGWSDPEYDRLIAGAATESDDARRYELLASAERILCTEQFPIIPLFVRVGNFMLNPNFEGLFDNPRDILPIQRVRPADESAGE